MTDYKGPERTSDGYMQAVEKGQDEARECSRQLREFLGIPETATTSDLSMVKELISIARDALKKETLRDQFAGGETEACGLAYRYADLALRYRDPSESEDE